jgi:hypothetical protein
MFDSFCRQLSVKGPYRLFKTGLFVAGRNHYREFHGVSRGLF